MTHGVTSHFYSDFGPKHTVNDQDGEPTKTLVVDEFFGNGEIAVAAKKHGLYP